MEIFIPNTNYKVHIPKKFNHYEYINTEYVGTNSVVVVARNLKTKNLSACKFLFRQMFIDNNNFILLEQELRILEKVKHPNICSVEKILYYEDVIVICMEYYNNGTLLDYIYSHDTLNENRVKKFAYGIVSGLEFLHRNNIAHRDIKLENIMLSDTLEPKIIDFGMSAEILPSDSDSLRSTLCGTLEYMPPEIISQRKYDPTLADMWSLGVSIYVMSTGHFPWRGTPLEVSKKILRRDISFPQTVSPSLKKLITSLVTPNPGKRPTSQELKKILEKDQLKFSSVPCYLSVSTKHCLPNIIKPTILKKGIKNVRSQIRV